MHPPHSSPLKQMLRRLSSPSSLLPPVTIVRAANVLSFTLRYVLLTLPLLFLDGDHGRIFPPLQSITLRYDGCLLAKHKHLRFRLAKKTSDPPRVPAPFYQKLWLLWCASQKPPPPGHCPAAAVRDCLLMGVFKNLFA